MSFLSNIFDPGKKDRQRAGALAQQAQIGSFGVTGPFGSTNYNASTGNVAFNLSPEMQALQAQLFGQAGGANASYQGLFDPFQANASSINSQYQGLFGGSFGGPFDQDRGLTRNLRNVAFAQIPQLTQNLDQLSSQRLDLLRQQAAPFESAAMGQLNQRLFSTGQGAVTGTAAQELGGGRLAQSFARGLGQADLDRQVAAEQFALGRQNQAASIFGGAVGQGLNLTNQAFSQGLGGAQFSADILSRMFGVNQGVFQAGTSALQGGQANQLGYIGAATGLNQALANPFQLALQANTARSNSLLGGSSTLASTAANTPSPFADLLGGVISGGATAAAGTPGASIFGSIFSDQRLKENILPTGIVEPLTGLDVYVWEWNDEAKRVGAHKRPPIGLLAQEVQKRFPEAVSESRGYLQIDYSKLHELVGA